MFWKRISIGDNERALLFKRERFIRILQPGDHWVFSLTGPVRVERHAVASLVFVSEWADFLVKARPALVARYFHLIETADTEVAVVFIDGKVSRVVPAASRVLFWKGLREITAELLDVAAAPVVPKDRLAALLRLGRESLVTVYSVESGKTGLLYLDNAFVRELSPGVYGFWTRYACLESISSI